MRRAARFRTWSRSTSKYLAARRHPLLCCRASLLLSARNEN